MGGKWGIYNPNVAKEYMRQAYNRGYGQPLISGKENGYGTTPFLTYLARRWNYDWLKLIAMRVDAERTPLMVLRRQIWMARFEYWVRRMNARKAVNRAAKVEWAYIKERVSQPMTWTGKDIQHFSLWALNVAAFFCIGEVVSRQYIYGYPVATPNGHHHDQSLCLDFGMFMIHLRIIHLTINQIILQNKCKEVDGGITLQKHIGYHIEYWLDSLMVNLTQICNLMYMMRMIRITRFDIFNFNF